MDPETIKALVKRSHEAKENAYSAYSQFKVGAALLCKDGSIFTGCNVENASYGLTICAERTAIVKAVSEGHRQFQAIAVASDMEDTEITPCGACRQFLVEFGKDWDVFMTKPDFTYSTIKAKDLLPRGFFPEQLEEKRLNHSE